MEKIKKLAPFIGVLVGFVIVIFGILCICGVFSDRFYSEYTYGYDYGLATFGTDYYTYSNNNAAMANKNAAVAAKNVGELINLVAVVSGIFLIGFGLLSICFFLPKVDTLPKIKKINVSKFIPQNNVQVNNEINEKIIEPVTEEPIEESIEKPIEETVETAEE